MREKAIAGMMAAAGKRKKELEEAITLKSVSGIHVAVQTTAELEPVPLQVRDSILPFLFLILYS